MAWARVRARNAPVSHGVDLRTREERARIPRRGPAYARWTRPSPVAWTRVRKRETAVRRGVDARTKEERAPSHVAWTRVRERETSLRRGVDARRDEEHDCPVWRGPAYARRTRPYPMAWTRVRAKDASSMPSLYPADALTCAR
jgi:hypothetical protein